MMDIAEYDKKNVAKNYNEYINYSRRVNTLKKLLNKVPKGYTRLLDLACGTGAVIEAIRKQPKSTILGIDISRSMLEIAQQHFSKQTNISFKRADFLKIKLPSSSFDLIVIAHAIRFVPYGQEDRFISRIHKWLRKDGMLVVVRYETLQIPVISHFLKRYLKAPYYTSSLNTEQGLLSLMNKKFHFVTSVKTEIVFHNSVGYRPSRIKAYYFKKRD